MRANYIFVTMLILVGCASQPDTQVTPSSWGQGIDAISDKPWPGYVGRQISVSSVDIGDRDRDGVVDHRDLCRNTVFGRNVRNDGCIASRSSVEFPNISITFDQKGKPNPEAMIRLDQFVHDHHFEIKSANEIVLIEAVHTTKNRRALDKNINNLTKFLVKHFDLDKDNIRFLDTDSHSGLQQDNYAVIHIADREDIQRLSWNIWSVEIQHD